MAIIIRFPSRKTARQGGQNTPQEIQSQRDISRDKRAPECHVETTFSEPAKSAETPPESGVFEGWAYPIDPALKAMLDVTFRVHSPKQNKAIIAHCSTLPKTALYRRYRSEWTAWRDMLQRAKRGERKVHPVFTDFRAFLLIMGRRPSRAYTLDRPDNSNLEYDPGNARWATKTVQNRNRSNVPVLTSPNGARWTAPELDIHHGLVNGTTRTRRNRGWTDAELIAGKRLGPIKPGSPTFTALVPVWHAACEEAYPGEYFPPLTMSDTKTLQWCESDCRLAGYAEAILRWAIHHWDDVLRAALHAGTLTLSGYREAVYAKPRPGLYQKYFQQAVNGWLEAEGLQFKNGCIVDPTQHEAVANML